VRAVLRRLTVFSRSRRAGDCAPYLAILLLLAWQKVCAQLVAPADDFFNGGAQFYISNNIPSALEKVESGLKIYPNDEKLKKLEALLKQQQQQQQQSQQNQQQQNQSQQQQQKNQQNQQQQKQNSQDQQKQDQQKQDQQKNDEQQKQQEQQKSSAEKKDGQQNAQNQQVAAGQMTPEEAKRLLDAQKGDEQILQWKPQGKPENQNKPVKDW
jgi:Ca-activated chloride channel family protein